MQRFMSSSFLRNTGLAFLLCVVTITLCHFFFDPFIAYKISEYHLSKNFFFKWMNQISMGAHLASFFLIIAMGIKAVWRPLTRNENCLLTLGVTAGASIYLKDFFKAIFGRYWPNTWYMNNPSLLKDSAYGFHFWHWDYAYGAFPSGHTTIVFCVMTFVWVLAPRWRWLAIAACTLQVIPLLALNYHFLGDLISGAFLGSLCAIFAIRINRLNPQPQNNL